MQNMWTVDSPEQSGFYWISNKQKRFLAEFSRIIKRDGSKTNIEYYVNCFDKNISWEKMAEDGWRRHEKMIKVLVV